MMCVAIVITIVCNTMGNLLCETLMVAIITLVIRFIGACCESTCQGKQ